MFEKILIANRGEIACRIIRTARRLGVRTVAVYSEADARARHVALADEAVLIGPPPARESYLDMTRILEAAARTDAEAVHPGYGFLAENASFAEACAEAGRVFIGPPPAAIRTMGEKAAAKRIMERAGVPVVPGYHGDKQDDVALAQAADEIGYPVLIKAVAGGGGRGMRAVETPDNFIAALKSARREAKAAFGDDRMLLETNLSRPRHIEVQVFADGHGEIVHLFERDCSIQRRHQKVIEEAPAPGMTTALRRIMGETAVAAARTIGYVGAGTVEFIADTSQGLGEDAFYFMEMNTRLQVEHPVTEMITGQDLVEWQLIVAAGGPLPVAQDDLTIDGHALEGRIYAEDPGKGFLPSTGILQRLRPPADSPHLRVDSGVVEGDEVTIHYDPMVAKLIAWDQDRATALRRLKDGLAAFQVAGVTTNVGFLSAVVRHPDFLAGDVETGFIDRHRDDLVAVSGDAPDHVIAIAVLDALLHREREARRIAAVSDDPHSPWARVDGWRLNDEGRDELHFLHGDKAVQVQVRYPGDGAYLLAIEGRSVRAQGELTPSGDLAVDLEGLNLSAAVVHHGMELTILTGGHSYRLTRHDPMDIADIEVEDSGHVTAPLPGKVVQVLVAPGAEVKKGASLLVLEAMKMEHTIIAPADGVVERINFEVGEQVEEGAELITFESGDNHGEPG